MRKSKIKQITLAVCLSLLPLAAFSAGLGKINVTSGLGEPLTAEIELLSVTPEELSTLIATIASDEAYNAQGIPRLAIHNNIKTEISKSAAGSPVIKIRSSQPVNDPYLDMLIQVDWASGRLQREYTVLLDPPGYKPAQVANIPIQLKAPVVSAPSNTLAESARTTIEANKEVKKSSPIVAKQAVKTKNTEPQAEPDFDSVTTQRGDTLSEIAKQMQPDGVSLDQMLVGLYENNKSAFTGGNMNRLKVGQIIKLPSREVLMATSEKQATKLVRAQSANWHEYRNSLAGAVTQLPATEEAEQKQTASGKIVTTEDKAITPKSGPQDVVKLSAGELDKQKASKDSNKEFEAKIAALQEETIAREKSLKEAQERTSALEKQIQDMQKLLALKSQNMAQIQKNAEAQKAAEASVKPAEKPATGVAASSNEKAPVTTEQIATPVAEASAPATKEANKNPVVVNPAKAMPPAVAPEAEISFINTLLGIIDTTILAAIAIVGLLAAGWMYLRNKRKKDLDSFERGILTSGGLRANTVFGNTTSATSNSDTSFLTDFAQSADGSMIDTNDVDPIAEAEVYMAYGRDAQAEEILKDAISKEPKRYELHLKLLEMYASRKDTSAFEAIAGELYTTLGSNDPTWAKVAVIGAEMEPGNPLYDISKISDVVSNQLVAQKLVASDFDNVDLASDLDLDFSAADQAIGANPAEKVEQDLSFDMGSLEMDSSNSESFSSNHLQAVDESENKSMDFDLGDFAENTEASANTGLPYETASATSLNVLDTMESMPTFDLEVKNDFEAPAFDLPLMDMPTAEIAASNSPVLQAKADNANEFNMDFDLPNEFAVISPEEASVEKVSLAIETFEAPISKEAEALAINTIDDLSFDLPMTDEAAIQSNAASPEVTEEISAPTVNEFDLSAINFDLGDATTTTDEISPAASSNLAFEDVEIKLDLVAAYIDMDDKEGARELLAEIMDEGGALQQARAKQLLDSLA